MEAKLTTWMYCVYTYMLCMVLYTVYMHIQIYVFEAQQPQQGEEEGSIIFRLIFIKWWLCTGALLRSYTCIYI